MEKNLHALSLRVGCAGERGIKERTRFCRAATMIVCENMPHLGSCNMIDFTWMEAADNMPTPQEAALATLSASLSGCVASIVGILAMIDRAAAWTEDSPLVSKYDCSLLSQPLSRARGIKAAQSTSTGQWPKIDVKNVSAKASVESLVERIEKDYGVSIRTLALAGAGTSFDANIWNGRGDKEESLAEAFERVTGSKVKSKSKGALAYEFRPINVEANAEAEHMPLLRLYLEGE